MSAETYDTKIRKLLDLGWTLNGIWKKSGQTIAHVTIDGREVYAVNGGRRSYDAFDRFYAAATATTSPPAEAQPTTTTSSTSVPLASPRQVDYIMTLLARRERDGEGGGFYAGPTTREGVARMTRREASTYIDSLSGRY